MHDTPLATDQAPREASGARPYGRYLAHPDPGLHGDTLFCETEVLDVRPSKSKGTAGSCTPRVQNPDGVLVVEFKRAVLNPRRP